MHRLARAAAVAGFALAHILAPGRCGAQRRPPVRIHYLGGWTIHHSGDYRGEIELDRRFVETFRPAHVFLIDRRGQELRTGTFARFLADHGAPARYRHGDVPGDLFVVTADSLVEHRRGR